MYTNPPVTTGKANVSHWYQGSNLATPPSQMPPQYNEFYNFYDY